MDDIAPPRPLLGELDLHLFNEGNHRELGRCLGAQVVTTQGKPGVRFAVWAPNARRVSVVGDFNGWDGRKHPLRARGHSGVWEGFVPRIGPGTIYKYEIEGPHGLLPLKADPVALQSEVPPRNASIVADPQPYEWSDADWMAGRPQRQSPHAPLSIYELHAGSWRRRWDEGRPSPQWDELGDQLIPYVKDLGFTHIELLPITAHPFSGSWGYQPLGLFAPHPAWGTPDQLRRFIDRCHGAGVGVIVDWVPAHFPTDAHGLGVFDGTHLFEHADPRRGFHPDWTSFIFNYGRHEVKAFLISSAISWLDRYHIDGLRVDGVASMLYKDYSRKPGEWVPNEDGSNHDREAIAFLQEFNRAVYRAYPDVQTIAEESTAWGGVSRPPEYGGLGFGYKWDLGWMHDTLNYLSRDPVHRKFHYDELTFRAIYANSENYVMPLSHDEVVHGKGAIIAKIHGDPWQKYASLRLLYGYQWTLPGKKLLYMGGELGVWGEWNHDAQLDWAIGNHEAHAGIARLIGDLNGAYRKYPALHRGDCEPWGFKWIVGDDRDASVLAFVRYGEPTDCPVVVVANFTPVPREGYRIGVPRAGFWKEIVNSDADVYGGSGMGNRGGMDAEHHECRGFHHSIVVTVPPLAIVVFAAER